MCTFASQECDIEVEGWSRVQDQFFKGAWTVFGGRQFLCSFGLMWGSLVFRMALCSFESPSLGSGQMSLQLQASLILVRKIAIHKKCCGCIVPHPRSGVGRF